MTFTISIGWWLLPVSITVASFSWGLWVRESERPTGGMFDGLDAAVGLMIRVPSAAAVSLAAWLVWALWR